ncbi:transporter substrate-binding domain-containing protein [Amycolatopsis sp. NBC_01480]|uniref:transporter substrate-binding domain-containing protein n=1 Tax=Amycolatopsis sp. NBC_01480 TaxID=2903562 RepID=UPI002E2C355B|nr:transporter substrate-binding domain-containing protein [Amycolatopsis sp. NBC_01480]
MIKTRVLALGVVLLVVLGVGTAAAAPGPNGAGRLGDGQLGAGRLGEIVARGELRVCSTGDYRPFTYLGPDGRWSGIDVDLAADLARRLGTRLALVRTTWAKVAVDVGNRCDLVMGGVSVTPARARAALFTTPYLRDGKTPITRCADVAKYATLAQIDRAGVRAIVNHGGTNDQFATANLHHATIVRYPDNNTIFDQLLAGRADLMITDASETRWQARQHPQLCAVHPDQPFTQDEKAYLLPRGEEAFRQFVDRWLLEVREDGTYARVTRPWLG